MSEPVWITLTGVSAIGHHGVFDFERRDGQLFSVDVRLEVLSQVGTDQLEGTVNYGTVAEQIHAAITGEPVQLIETLAARIADDVLTDPLVRSVEVTVHKPSAPISVEFGNVAVTLTRRAGVTTTEGTQR